MGVVDSERVAARAEAVVTQVATRLKELRLRRELSQRELARLARVSLGTVQAVEEGQSAPSLRILARLAYALGVELTELLAPEDGAEDAEMRDLLRWIAEDEARRDAVMTVARAVGFAEAMNAKIA